MLIFSCNHVYKEYDKQSFPTYSWQHGQSIIFTPTIEDIHKSYSLTLGIRHLYNFQLPSILVSVKMISPSGKESTKDYELKIKDANDKNIGSCGGDLCDLEVAVDDTVQFDEAGQYKYLITHNVPVNRIPGVMEFGLIIDMNN